MPQVRQWPQHRRCTSNKAGNSKRSLVRNPFAQAATHAGAGIFWQTRQRHCTYNRSRNEAAQLQIPPAIDPVPVSKGG